MRAGGAKQFTSEGDTRGRRGRHPGDGEPGELGSVYAATLRYIVEQRKLGRFTKQTAQGNQSTLRRFADSVGDVPLEKVDRDHVERWMLGLDCAPGTARRQLSTVRCFLQWCVEHRLLKRDPTYGIRSPRQPRKQPRALDGDQVTEVLAHADDRARVVILLMVQEGLRVGGVASLTTDSVDVDARVVFVTEKGGHQRFVPLSDQTYKAIDAYLTAHPAGPGRPLIRSYQHPARGVSARHLSQVVSDLMRDAGVKRAARDGKSAHALRHTCANDMLDNGAEIRDVQEMLGHVHLSTTTIYLRRQVALNRLRDAAAGRNYG